MDPVGRLLPKLKGGQSPEVRSREWTCDVNFGVVQGGARVGGEGRGRGDGWGSVCRIEPVVPT